MFARDNVGLTAKQIAANKNDQTIVKILDKAESECHKKMSKRVEKAQKRADLDMDKNIAKYEKIMINKNQFINGLDFSQEIDSTATISPGNANVMLKSIRGPVAAKPNGRTDIRDIYPEAGDENVDNPSEYSIDPTGIFSTCVFGQRIFFRQNAAISEQMEQIESEKTPLPSPSE